MVNKQRMKQADYFELPVPQDTPKHTPLRVGVLNVVTVTPEGKGVGNVDGYATCALVGSFELEVQGAGTGNPGDAVYITSGGVLNLTATGNTLWGALVKAKAGGTQNVEVRPVGN